MANFEFVNLNWILNHKLIAPRSDEDKLTYMTQSEDSLCCADSLPESNKIIKIDHIPFYFPKFDKNSCDNLQCKEQKIDFTKRKYTAVHVLGYSDFEDFEEDFTFFDSVHPVLKIPVLLHHSWRGSRPFSLQYTDNRCSFALLAKTLNLSPIGIFRFSDSFRESIDSCSLSLPLNPGMHIFAITLEY